MSDILLEVISVLNKTVFARMKEEDFLLLKKSCEAEDETISSFVRRAIKLLLESSESKEKITNSEEGGSHLLGRDARC
jgi:hypothetical protein